MLTNRRRSYNDFPPVRRFISDGRYLSRFFWMSLGLIFFIFPAMMSGGKTLYDVFLSPNAYHALVEGEEQSMPIGQVVEEIAWRVTVIGIVFCIGWAIVLISTRGYSDLEYVLVCISLVMVLTAAAIAAIMTDRCYDMNCEDFKFFAGVACIISITILAFVISAGVGKQVGWFSLLYLPVLAYQTFLWIPYLFTQNQHERVMDGVLKATGLLVTVLIMAVILAVAGGWPGKGRGNPT
jgi:hypothetical protein